MFKISNSFFRKKMKKSKECIHRDCYLRWVIGLHTLCNRIAHVMK